MTLDDVLHELIGCLGAQGDSVIDWEQVRHWPKGAIEIFQKAEWLKAMSAAEMIECLGCEENCFMPVELPAAAPGKTAMAFVACEKMGRVDVSPAQLQQWQLTQTQIAKWISNALDLRSKPEKDAASRTFKLGTIQGKARLAELHLDLNNPVSLKASGHTRPLSEITFVSDGQPSIERAAILAMADLPPASVQIKGNTKKRAILLASANQENLEIGTRQWREQTARNAANARHNQPGGSRNKQQQIREMWATGKYSSRDRCAEEECAALDMSFAAARKALKNTPNP